MVAVVFGPGQETEGDGVGAGNFAFALGVGKVTVEAGEGGQAEAGSDDALDDVDATTELGEGHGSTTDRGSFTGMNRMNEMNRMG